MAQLHSQTQEYFLPGYGLSRSIVISHLQFFLGPSVRVRPYSFQSRDGFLIVGTPLTRGQIDDLQSLSRQHERQEAIRMSRSQDAYINEIVPLGRRTSPDYSHRDS